MDRNYIDPWFVFPYSQICRLLVLTQIDEPAIDSKQPAYRKKLTTLQILWCRYVGANDKSILIDELLYIGNGIADALWKQSRAILSSRPRNYSCKWNVSLQFSCKHMAQIGQSDSANGGNHRNYCFYRIAHEINASQESTAQ